MIDAVICHLLGDYVLQIDYIAKTKGENFYHMIVHCVLYVLPFRVVYGLDARIYALFASHIIIDMCKAKWKIIDYVDDQMLHYLMIAILYIIPSFYLSLMRSAI